MVAGKVAEADDGCDWFALPISDCCHRLNRAQSSGRLPLAQEDSHVPAFRVLIRAQFPIPRGGGVTDIDLFDQEAVVPRCAVYPRTAPSPGLGLDSAIRQRSCYG